jgi:predicted nucleic acid-binding protein
MIDGQAAWCDLVWLELWNGARGSHEKEALTDLEKEILCLPTSTEVWDLARRLARESRDAGKTVPATDLIIAACGLFHQVKIEHCDIHFDFIIRLHESLSLV